MQIVDSLLSDLFYDWLNTWTNHDINQSYGVRRPIVLRGLKALYLVPFNMLIIQVIYRTTEAVGCTFDIKSLPTVYKISQLLHNWSGVSFSLKFFWKPGQSNKNATEVLKVITNVTNHGRNPSSLVTVDKLLIVHFVIKKINKITK